MAEWKKVIVSGSEADLAHVSASGNIDVVGTITAARVNTALGGVLEDGNGIANFSYDGSAAATVTVDLDGSTLSLGSSGVKVADGGVDTTQLASNAVTTAKITDANVTLAKIANAAANTVIVRDANSSGVLSAKAVTNTQILIGDGTGFTAAALSGDVTMTNAGAVTIADDAVETSMIGDEQVTLAKLAHAAANTVLVRDANSAGDPSFKAVTNTQILIGDGTGFTAAALSGDVTMTNAGAVTIANGAVETAMIADNAVDGDKLADDITVAGALTVVGGASASFFSSSGEIVTQGNIITTSGSFSGDGSNLTGVAAASVNIDGLSDYNAQTLHQSQDHFMVSDNGTEKKINFSDLEDSIFANISGDATVAGGGALTIANTAVETAMIADDAVDADKLAANAVVNASIASNAAIAHSKLAALASTKVLVGNGSNVATAVALSGDVTMDNAGAVTIANTAVETAMIAADAVTAAKLADDAVVTANIVDANVTTAKIANDAVTGDKLANDITIANDLTVTRDLIVNGTSVTVNTANLNVEDPFILLKSGSSNTTDSGIIFGGSTGTANSGKAIIWDASYNSNDGRLAVSTTAVAGDATANFGAGTAGYYVAGVFEGSEADVATAKSDHAGNIRIESSEIYIYV